MNFPSELCRRRSGMFMFTEVARLVPPDMDIPSASAVFRFAILPFWQCARSITPSPPTKSLDFRGFDSSRLLILMGGNSHVR